ncbi:MAG TPA: preprotein translocase subunit SecY [Patescibacteria group bacterium]|nr:preprotein translocase subunit SecY [Patescibacteria group bacterium]
MFLKKIQRIWGIKDLRKKILFVLSMLIIFRIAAHIPVPGVNIENLKELFSQNQMLGMLNVMSGGAMSNFSVVAMGVAPFITASIIMQLLTMIVPKLEELSKQGPAGRKKINQYSRFLTVPLAIFQSYGMITLLRQSSATIVSDLSLIQTLHIMLVMTAGTVFLMWLGELITEKNIGNGVSLIIFAGIVERIPASLQQTIVTFSSSKIMEFLILTGLAVITIAGVVMITQAQRNIPVTYARRVRGRKMFGGRDTYLPLKVNQAGMIPIIFAISVVLFPGLIGKIMMRSGTAFIANVGEFLAGVMQNQLIYGLIYFALVVAFAYFYTSIVFHPDEISENLQKQGGFIPGIRPGDHTSDYLAAISKRVMFAGAMSLGIIAVLPVIIQNTFQTSSFVIGGAAVLIVVSVVLRTVKQIKAQISMHEYEGGAN